MEINQMKAVKVDVTTLEMCVKVSDRFTYSLKDAQGQEVFDQDDGYVPDIMPGKHYGDYIMLTIDLATGVILNWVPPTAAQLEEIIAKNDDE